MPNDAYVGPLASKISEWAERLVIPYIDRHPNPALQRKQIHDPLDRIIELEPWEVYVVDSPIFQRLRYIRQLGVGHFLFPTAGYSRFEHSLGAMQTASSMFDSLVSSHRESKAQAPAYTDQDFQRQKRTVRLAALLHDIGHCVFSHVSERFYQEDSGLILAQKHFRNHLQKRDISASETLSLLIVQSESFKKLLVAAHVRDVHDHDGLVRDMMRCIGGSVARMAPDSYLAEIVNGPVDCDKLDYLARDAYTAGVPIPLDITRLLSKLRIAVKKKAGESDKYTLAVAPSGMRALDELQVARIFLYDKFYYHQKVMAAEELIRRGLAYLAMSIPSIGDPAVLLPFGDDELLSLTPEMASFRFGSAIDQNIKKGCELLRRVRNRELPKRVFALANRFIPEEPEGLNQFHAKGRQTKGRELNVDFYDMTSALRKPNGADGLRKEIAALADTLGTKTEVYVAHQAAGRAAGSMHLPVLRPDGRLDENPRYLFPNDFWSEAYATNKATNYVFADNPTANVFLAAERRFAEEWNLRFDRSCWVTAKISEDLIEARREHLTGDWLPFSLPPDVLERPSNQLRVEKLNKKFASFLTAFHADWGPTLIDAWLAQFADGDLRDSALCFLEHMTFVGPETIDRAFESYAAGDPGIKNGVWVPFRAKTGAGDSADQLSVDLKELKVRNRHISTLAANEIREAGCVVFYDDTLNSGIQSECRLLAWFGGKREDCNHLDDWDESGPLPADVQEALRSTRIVLAVYAKHPSGDARVRNAARSLGLTIDVLGVIDSGQPKYTVEGFAARSDESRTRFIAELSRIGETLLTPKIGKPGWDEDRVKRSSLGYSGIPLTVLFRHSISASTPVALWETNEDFEFPWLPVFPRERKNLRRILGERLEEYQGAS